MSIVSVMPSNHLIFCSPLLLLSSIFPRIRAFSNELAFHRWPKDWSFSISPSNEYSELISLRIGWFILRNWLTGLWGLQSKGHSRIFSNTTNKRHQFLGAQSSLWSKSHIHTRLLEKKHCFDYMDLCLQSSVSVFNMLSRFVIAFFLRS